MTDVSATPPTVPQLSPRGTPKTPGDPVWRGTSRNSQKFPEPPHPPPSQPDREPLDVVLPSPAGSRPGSPPGSIARAGDGEPRLAAIFLCTGIVATPDNLGLSGAPQPPPRTARMAGGDLWIRMEPQALHRAILHSATFDGRRSRVGRRRPGSLNRRLWRFPLPVWMRKRCATPCCPPRAASVRRRAVLHPDPAPGRHQILPDKRPRRSVPFHFPRHRRTQVPTLATTFDAPSVVFNCTRRATTTMPLQSLAVLNSDFAVAAERISPLGWNRTAAMTSRRIRRGFHSPADANPPMRSGMPCSGLSPISGSPTPVRRMPSRGCGRTSPSRSSASTRFSISNEPAPQRRVPPDLPGLLRRQPRWTLH